MLVAFLCAPLWLAWSRPASAVEESISFKSDYQQELRKEQILLLQGHVEVHFRDLTIYADEVRLNDAKDEFFGAGNVRLVGTDRDIFADSVWYNYARDEFDMRNARGSLMAQGVTEVVWFRAEQLRGNINDYQMVNGRVTTCTPEEHQEYAVEARLIKVLPGNKVIFRNGYFFIMNLPVFWFPYWAFSVRETPWEVSVGKNPSDGTYVKTKYNYLAQELIVGSLILDYFSRTGWTVGANHNYVLPKHGSGSAGWTFTRGTFRDDKGQKVYANEYTFGLTQALLFGNRFTGNLAVSASSDFNPRVGRSNYANGSFNAAYNVGNARTSFDFRGNQTSGISQSSTMSIQLVHGRNLFQNITSSFTFNYSANKSGNLVPADEDFTTKITFSQNLTGWNWNATVDSHWDPDRLTNISDRNKPYTDKLPEVNITFQPNAFPGRYRNWLGFQMQALNLVGALVYVGPERSEIQGFVGHADTSFSRNDDLGSFGKLQYNIQYWQGISSTGDAKWVYSTTVNWNWDPTSRLNSRTTWNRNDEEGRIPFSNYDRSGQPGNRLTYNLTYRMGSVFTGTMSTSYWLNERYSRPAGQPGLSLLSTKRMQVLSFSFNYTPNRSTSVTLSIPYDVLKSPHLGSISSSVSLTNGKTYTLRSDLGFQPPGNLTSFSTTSTFIIGKDWDFKVSTQFARKASDNILQSISITHRLDCTFLSFQYSGQDNQWSINWGVTGYPQAHLGYSTTEQRFGPGFFNTFGGSGSGFTGLGF